MLVFTCFVIAHSINSIVLILMQFILIKVFKANKSLALVIELARL